MCKFIYRNIVENKTEYPQYREMFNISIIPLIVYQFYFQLRAIKRVLVNQNVRCVAVGRLHEP